MFKNIPKLHKSQILKKVLASTMVICLTFANIYLLGFYIIEGLTSYAIDTEHKNVISGNENVEFDAYFKEQENKTHSLVSDINEKNNLFINIAVKNSGYLKNASIELRDKQNTANTNYEILINEEELYSKQTIQKINKEEKKITLAQIGEGSSDEEVEMHLLIGLDKTEELEISKLNQESKVILKGTYVDNKGNDNNIEEEIYLNIGWEVESEAQAELTQELIAFKPYSYIENEEIKKGIIAQLEVKSNQKFETEQTIYLPEETKIELEPIQINEQLPQEITVIAKTTQGTNGDKQVFTANNWSVDEENNKKTILTVKNEKDEQGKIYVGEGQDTYYITYKYGEEAYNALQELEEITLNSNISSKIKIYSSEEVAKEITAQAEENYELNNLEEGLPISGFGNIVSVEINNTKEITKGAIYANTVLTDKNYGTVYNTDILLNIADTELVKEILINNITDSFIDESENTYFSIIKNSELSISKENFKEILGENGAITIFNNQEEKIAIINNTINTQANITSEIEENPNYIINLEDYNLNELTIKTTKPIKSGLLKMEIKKIIDSNTELNYMPTLGKNLKLNNQNEITENEIVKNMIKSFKKINSTVNLKGVYVNAEQEKTSNKAQTTLNETTTNSTIEINPQNLSTTQTNKNVQVAIKLNNNNINSDLYINPEFTMFFPEIVELVSVNSTNLTYENGLKLVEQPTVEGNNCKIKLTGTQEEFNIINETTILLDVNIKLRSTTPTTTENVVLEYKNENVNKYKENLENGLGTATTKISTNVPEKILEKITNGETLEKLTSNISITRGEETLNNETVLYEGETIKYKVTLENTGVVELNNIQIKSTIPEGLELITENENTQNINDIVLEIGEGEKLEKEYELKVKSINNEQNVTLAHYIEVIYKENINSSKAINSTVQKAKLEVTLVNAYKECLVTQGENVEYWMTVKNISGEELKNVEAKIILINDLTYSSAYNSQNEKIEPSVNNNNVIFNIGALSADESITITMFAKANENINKSTDVKVYAQAHSAQETNKIYTSSVVTKKIYYKGVEASLTCETASKLLNIGDEITYILTLNNNGETRINKLEVEDILPEQLEPISIMLGENSGIIFNGELTYNTELSEGETKTIIIKAKVREGILLKNDIQIENFVTITSASIKQETNKILHSIKANVTRVEEDNNQDQQNNNNEEQQNNNNEEQQNSNNEEQQNNNNEEQQNNNNQEQQNDSNKTKTTYKISGLAWLDEDKNGKREEKEKLLKDIVVKLYNAKTNAQIKETKTNENGVYEFTELPSGVYTVMFIYDENEYVVTEYQKQGINSAINSDAMPVIPTITDVIEIKATDVQNVDIGLKLKEKFDLSLNKYISKITVQNDNGTTITNYENSTLAKTSIKGKHLTGSTVIVEYKIVITNNGAVPRICNKSNRLFTKRPKI